MKILSNKIQCKACGDIIESTHTHDFKWCSCGACAIDGGKSYLKRCAKNLEVFVDLSNIEFDQHLLKCDICGAIHNYELEVCNDCGRVICDECKYQTGECSECHIM